jgi:hypothetical protein
MAITTNYAYGFTDLPIVLPPDTATVADLQEAVKRLKASTHKYDNPRVEIILPEKEPTMKPLFNFTTIKPSAEVIWNTLSTQDISATSGYTADQLKFYMYVVLQLRTDFKSAKELCNNYESRTSELHVAMRDLLDLNTNTSSAVKLPPVGFTDWVEPELYTPYYMFKQLGIKPTNTLWFTLFGRVGQSEVTHQELESLWSDTDPISESITAYKLWYYGNDIIHEAYSKIFSIDNGLSPNVVLDRIELMRSLVDLVYDYLDNSESHIFDYSSAIVIRPFKLGVSDAPQ